MKLYLAGPMSGHPKSNFPAFHSAAKVLRGEGHEVVSPAELDEDEGHVPTDNGLCPDREYEHFMERDFEILAEVEGVVFLPGWTTSGGAGREGRRAIALGLPLFTYAPGTRRGIMALSHERFLRGSTTQRRTEPLDVVTVHGG